MITRRPDNAVWFELPTSDFDRAVRFWEGLFGVTLHQEDMGPMKLGVFPYSKPHISGCVFSSPHLKPSTEGTVVYLNVDGKLDDCIARVESLGGKILMPKVTLPGDMGSFVHIADSEGNRVGLHAVN